MPRGPLAKYFSMNSIKAKGFYFLPMISIHPAKEVKPSSPNRLLDKGLQKFALLEVPWFFSVW